MKALQNSTTFLGQTTLDYGKNSAFLCGNERVQSLGAAVSGKGNGGRRGEREKYILEIHIYICREIHIHT